MVRQHAEDVINETNNFENRFSNIRDEEKMLAVKKLMLESLLNYRSMSYRELLVALENIIIYKVATVPTARNRKIDAGSLMEIEMAAEKGDQKIVDFDLRLSLKELAKTNGVLERFYRWNEKGYQGGKGGKDGRRTHGRRVAARKEAKGKRNCKGETITCWTCNKTGHIAAWCRKGGNKHLYAIDEDDSENVEGA